VFNFSSTQLRVKTEYGPMNRRRVCVPVCTDGTELGAGQAHPNMQPFPTMNYRSTTVGTYPSRD